ncbi:unnamed protein product [Ascophyllum nodosum]
MGHLSVYRRCMGCLVALLALQSELAMAFLRSPQTRVACTWRPGALRCKTTPKLNGEGQTTTRKEAIEEMSTVASVIAASGATLINNPASANAALRFAASVLQEDRRGVEETAILWKDTVTSGTSDAPDKTAALYAPDSVLWGTVSEEVRDTPEEIFDYFDYFARLPKLRLSEYTPVSLRVYGDFATQAGTYTFAWQGADGGTTEKRARFSFTFRRDPSSPTGWTIVEHHSSVMPRSPAQLKHAKNIAES